MTAPHDNADPLKIRHTRKRKLSLKDRRAIYFLYQSGEWTMKHLASRFGVSQPRICQIVNDSYGELEAVLETHELL